MRIAWRMVRLLVLIVAFASALRFAAPAQAADTPLSPADKTAIHDIVQSQLDAFRKDDGAKAFSYASPAIRSVFMNSDNFMAMVKTGYAPVYRPRAVQFGPIETVEGVPEQHVFLVGPDGASVDAVYFMERESDGNWRINGCELRQGSAA